MRVIMIPTSSIKDDADEVITDQPTRCPVHRDMFMSARMLKHPE